MFVVKKYQDGWYRGIRYRGYQVLCMLSYPVLILRLYEPIFVISLLEILGYKVTTHINGNPVVFLCSAISIILNVLLLQ